MMLSDFWERVNLLAQIELEPQICSFFTTILELNEDLQVNTLLKEIFNARTDLSEEHLAYLLWVAFQYTTNFSYLEDNGEFEQSDISSTFKERLSLIYQLCLKNNVSTNLPSRYAAL